MKIFCILTALSIVVFLVCCSNADKGANLTAGNTVAINTANTNNASAPSTEVMDGAGLYKKNCAACHRGTGTGGKVTLNGRTINPDDLTTERKKSAPDEKFHAWISNGVPDEGMPAF